MLREPHKEGIVAFLPQNGTPVGAGILVDRRHVMTAAHVVNAALGVSLDAQQKPDQPVMVCFPLLLDAEPLRARVVAWLAPAPRMGSTSEDVAVLELLDDPPAEVQPIAFIEPERVKGSALLAFGFPASNPRLGNYAKCEVIGRAAGGWFYELKVTSGSGTVAVQKGFSGTAVLVNDDSDAAGLAIGMVVAAPKVLTAGYAYMIDFHGLQELPQLTRADAPPVSPLSPAWPPWKLRSAESLYLEVLLSKTSHINIHGLRSGDHRAEPLPIEKFYIKLHASGSMESSKERSGHRHEEEPGSSEVELHEALANRHLVVVGQPGSGKTTALRRIAHLLCQTRLGDDPHAAKDQLDLSPCPFPLFVGVARFLEYIRKNITTAQDLPEAVTWLPNYLAVLSRGQALGMPLDKDFFQSRLADENTILLLDGLDEAPSKEERASAIELIENLSRVYPCRIVVTTRPASYKGKNVLATFDRVEIAPLHDEAMEQFLKDWYETLLTGEAAKAAQLREGLLKALHRRPKLLRLARNPLMLTVMALVHWKRDRLPDQRAELYRSIIEWLAESRPKDRLPPAVCLERLSKLALAMQDHSECRKEVVLRDWAADVICDDFTEVDKYDRELRLRAAVDFLFHEELHSGIVESVGDQTKFWHLTFQEYLAAWRLSKDGEKRNAMIREETFFHPEWREVALLLAGCLYDPDPDLESEIAKRRVDALFSDFLNQLYGSNETPGRRQRGGGKPAKSKGPSLADRARCAGLLGAAVQDLSPYDYKPSDVRYDQLMQEVLSIFDAEKSGAVPIEVAIEAAEALGQAGDPRLLPQNADKNWIDFPTGKFLMGSQKDDPKKPNYDKEADDNECPPVEVFLDAYRIGRYPVTVAEYERFIEADGYEKEEHWESSGFRQFEKPENWEEQLLHSNRPIVGVSWYEAMAYAAWAGHRLLTEAQWERAARGVEGRRYPWGNDEPVEDRLNFASNIGDPTPVGVYPGGRTPEGVADMAGNVREWCCDAFQATLPGGDNPCVEEAAVRVFRGGCWLFAARSCRSAHRDGYVPGDRYGILGFRVAAVQ